jgi:hypothetical protein
MNERARPSPAVKVGGWYRRDSTRQCLLLLLVAALSLGPMQTVELILSEFGNVPWRAEEKAPDA